MHFIDFQNYDADELAEEIVNYIKKKGIDKVEVETSVKGPDRDYIDEEKVFSKEEFNSLKEFLLEYIGSDGDRYLTMHLPEIKTTFEVNLGDVEGDSKEKDFKETFSKYE